MRLSYQPVSYSIIGAFLRGLTPDAIITVSEWAETYRVLPQVSAEPGKFRMSRTPYNKEIADRLSVTDPAQTIIFKKSSQIGATETANNWFGYIVDVAPAPLLFVMPTDTMMKDTSKNRIQKLIDDTPRIKEKIKPTRSKDSSNTLLFKEFEGGFAKMVGANSPIGLASTSVRYVYLDEIDRYPLSVGGEGSAIKLADTRTVTFGARKKKFLTSTPTRKGMSAIDAAFETTGQREYHVPCPHCGAAQALIFEQLRYEKGKYAETTYECIHCKEQISERFKTQMLSKGTWIAKFPEKEDGITYGYFINALYSPYGMYSWGDMAKEYDDSEGNIPDRITWTNTKKGEVYEEDGEVPQWELIYSQRQKYSQRTCKVDVAFITAGVDVQADRLEIEIVGWMKGKRSQSIEYRIIAGDTSKDETWDQLQALLNEVYLREDNASIPITMMAVDTGYNTSHVYDFCTRTAVTGKVIPVKGKDGLSMIFSAPKPVQYTRAGKKVNNVKVYLVGVSLIKSELYGWLKQTIKDDEVPPGYCYFPEYGTEYFRGLTGEKLERTNNKNGYPVFSWVKHYKRNEPLDCRVYARAAAAVYGMDLFTDQTWQKLAENAGIPQNKLQKPKEKKKSSFWRN